MYLNYLGANNAETADFFQFNSVNFHINLKYYSFILDCYGLILSVCYQFGNLYMK